METSSVEKRPGGQLFVFSGPSGVGKSTILKNVIAKDPNVRFSVSWTTRNKRKEEVNGVDYRFVSKSEFVRGIREGWFLEWAEVHGEYYGTEKETVFTLLKEGYDVILDINVQGARRVRCYYPDAQTVFIVPPSLETLAKRLETRRTESPKQLKKRLETARDELQEAIYYDYIVVNDILEKAINDCLAILRACRCLWRNRVALLRTFFHTEVPEKLLPRIN